jgi:hypothetical protein
MYRLQNYSICCTFIRMSNYERQGEPSYQPDQPYSQLDLGTKAMFELIASGGEMLPPYARQARDEYVQAFLQANADDPSATRIAEILLTDPLYAWEMSEEERRQSGILEPEAFARRAIALDDELQQ